MNFELLNGYVPLIHQCSSAPGYPRTVTADAVFGRVEGVGARENNVPYTVHTWDKSRQIPGEPYPIANLPCGFYGASPSLITWRGPGSDDSGKDMSITRSARLSRITDGLSKTGMVFEQSGLPRTEGDYGPSKFVENATWRHSRYLEGTWAFSSQFSRVLVPWVNIRNVESMYSFHPSGVNVSRFDGSVFFLNEDAQEGVVVDLFARANSGQ